MEIGSVKRIHMNEWKNTGVPFFRARDIVAKFNNKKISDPIYISEKTYNSNILKSGKVKKGQLLITGVGTIGIPYLITDDSPLYFKDGNVIWLKNNNYDGNFIFYFFTTNLFKNYLFKITGTGTVGTYTIENAKKTPISIPQINEQIRIGKLFNILENLLTLYERKLKLLLQVKKYFLDNLFTEKEYPNLRFKGFTGAWEQRKLGAITDTYSGGTPQVSVKGYYSNNEIPFIRSSDIHKDKTELYISSKGLKNSSAKLVSKGYILYALYGATSGEVDISKIDGAINQAVLCINANNDLNYFLMLFLSKNKDKIVQKYIQGGQGNLSASIIKKIKVFTTSKLEEIKISNFVKILSDIIALYENKQQHLIEIKKTLLNTMFI